MTEFNTLSDIDALLNKHIAYRNNTLNLIASENLVSDSVRGYLANELVDRYGCYTTEDLAEREYMGNRYIYEMEAATQALACEVFHAKYTDLRPLGGHMAGIACAMAVTEPGDTVIEYHLESWGHGLVGPSCDAIPHYDQTLKVRYVKLDSNMHLDLAHLEQELKEHKVRCVIVGFSGMLFADPIADIKGICERYGACLVADVSHVSGLIAGGVYPNPLDSGADLMFCSTHKSFPGPQGGMVFSNSQELIEKVGNILAPGMVTSHHVHRLPALAAALLEVKQHGAQYGKQIIANAQALGKALHNEGFAVLAADENYTQSHLILANIENVGHSHDVARRLESAGIFVSDDFGESGKEIRIGTPEITRRGMTEKDMPVIASLFRRLLIDNESPEIIGNTVKSLVSDYQGIEFNL